MNYYSEEELERALFALPLEEPPADLHGAILSRTIYRAPIVAARWELAGLISVAFAACVLLWMIVAGGGTLFDRTVLSAVAYTGHALNSLQTLLWLGIGCATAFALSLSFNSPVPVRRRIAKR